MIDYKGGHKVYNNTERIRCASRLNCNGLVNPEASLFEQARTVLVREHSTRSVGGFIEDGDFIRFRELSRRLLGARGACRAAVPRPQPRRRRRQRVTWPCCGPSTPASTRRRSARPATRRRRSRRSRRRRSTPSASPSDSEDDSCACLHISRRRSLRSGLRKATWLAAAGVMLVACSPTEILEVTDPDIINPSDVTTPPGPTRFASAHWRGSAPPRAAARASSCSAASSPTSTTTPTRSSTGSRSTSASRTSTTASALPPSGRRTGHGSRLRRRFRCCRSTRPPAPGMKSRRCSS